MIFSNKRLPHNTMKIYPTIQYFREFAIDKKRMPITDRHQANTLEEIGIYTDEDTKPLSEIFDIIAKKEIYLLFIAW